MGRHSGEVYENDGGAPRRQRGPGHLPHAVVVWPPERLRTALKARLPQPLTTITPPASFSSNVLFPQALITHDAWWEPPALHPGALWDRNSRVLQCLRRPPESPRPLQPPERTEAAAARAAALPLQILRGAGACVNPWVPLPGVQRWPPVPRGAAAKHLLQLPSCVLLRSAPLLSLSSLKTHSCGG